MSPVSWLESVPARVMGANHMTRGLLAWRAESKDLGIVKKVGLDMALPKQKASHQVVESIVSALVSTRGGNKDVLPCYGDKRSLFERKCLLGISFLTRFRTLISCLEPWILGTIRLVTGIHGFGISILFG